MNVSVYMYIEVCMYLGLQVSALNALNATTLYVLAGEYLHTYTYTHTNAHIYFCLLPIHTYTRRHFLMWI